MNCQKCNSGVLEHIGKSEMLLKTNQGVSKNVKVDVFACSVDWCSHVHFEAPVGIIREIKAEQHSIILTGGALSNE